MYEETTGEQGEREGDSSCDDEDQKKEPPPEPTRFGWIQGVMVGRVSLHSVGMDFSNFTVITNLL